MALHDRMFATKKNVLSLEMWGKELLPYEFTRVKKERKGMALWKSNSRNWHKGIALALNISHIHQYDSDTATLLDKG